MKILCDHMLGRLARWLRFMGYDTAYPEAMSDTGLRDRARAEGRILLTRDKELAARVPGAVRLRSVDLEGQIREVAAAIPLRVVEPLSRCSVCNARIEAAPPDAVRDFVPDGVRARHTEFWRCPTCGRVYWRGSHWDKMIERLNRLDLPA